MPTSTHLTAWVLNAKKGEFPAIIEIDVPATEEPEQFIVKGQIRAADKSPLVNGVVCAFDKDLRQEQLLGETAADGEGCYQTAYTRARFRRMEKK